MKSLYKIKQWDSFELINKIKDNSVDLVITSPPYNVGKVYEKKDKLEKYLEPYKQFTKTLFEKVSQTWSVCRQVGNYIEKGEVYPLDIYFYDIFKEAGFKLRNRVDKVQTFFFFSYEDRIICKEMNFNWPHNLYFFIFLKVLFL